MHETPARRRGNHTQVSLADARAGEHGVHHGPGAEERGSHEQEHGEEPRRNDGISHLMIAYWIAMHVFFTA